MEYFSRAFKYLAEDPRAGVSAARVATEAVVKNIADECKIYSQDKNLDDHIRILKSAGMKYMSEHGDKGMVFLLDMTEIPKLKVLGSHPSLLKL